MAITYTRKQTDKFGDKWDRDNFGGWTNEYGVRFTKAEHQRFGYRIRKANEIIKQYMEKYPYPKELKVKDIASRFRREDLGRFRRRSAYKNYLRVTEAIIRGYQLGIKMPRQYRQNFLKGLDNDNIKLIANKNAEIKSLLKIAKNKLKKLTYEESLLLSRDPKTPFINQYYTPDANIIKSELELLIDVIEDKFDEKI